MKLQTKFIGIVTQIININTFTVRINMEIEEQISQIIGIKLPKEQYLLAVVNKIETQYFLNNTDEYFTALSVDNKLQGLANKTINPRFGKVLQAEILGIYEYSGIKHTLEEIENSVPCFTPNILDSVEILAFEDIIEIFGLSNKDSSLFIGEMLYPKYSDIQKVQIPIESFNAHTLISGVTGTGKSRLAALLANNLAQAEREVFILDPHNEYRYLINEQIHREIIQPNKAKEYLEKQLNSFTEPQFNENFKTLIIDEVHTLLKDKECKELLELLLRSSRKFGLATIFITQNQDDVPEEMRGQFQNYFCFREKKSDTTKHLKDQTCMCLLRSGKVSFPMRVNTIELIKGDI